MKSAYITPILKKTDMDPARHGYQVVSADLKFVRVVQVAGEARF